MEKNRKAAELEHRQRQHFIAQELKLHEVSTEIRAVTKAMVRKTRPICLLRHRKQFLKKPKRCWRWYNGLNSTSNFMVSTHDSPTRSCTTLRTSTTTTHYTTFPTRTAQFPTLHLPLDRANSIWEATETSTVYGRHTRNVVDKANV